MLDLNYYQEQLEKQLTKVTEELSTIGTYDRSNDNWEAILDETEEAASADLNINADLVESWNERRAILSTLEREYHDTKRALQKITAGTFGICEISGQAIEEDRLRYLPTARTCEAHMDKERELPM